MMDEVYTEDVEFRSENDGNTIIGYAALFNSVIDMGGGYERIAPTAFDNVLVRNDTDTVALNNHNHNEVLGRRSSGTLRLAKSDKGLRFEIDLPNTSYGNDVRELIKRGDLKGASFACVPGDDTLERSIDGRQIRTHTNIKDLRDISITAFPAYKETSIQLRNIDIEVKEDKDKKMETEIKTNVNPSPEDILVEMRTLMDTAEQENRSLTVDEMRTYESYERNLIGKRNDEIRSRHEGYLKPASMRSDIHVHTAVQKPADDEYMQEFDRYLRTGDVSIVNAFQRAQSAGVGSEGGFTVPEAFRQKLVDNLVAFGGLASVSEVITTTSGEAMRWPTLDDTTNLGVIAAENTAPVGGADLVFGEKTLSSFRYIAPGASALPLRVSVELLQDSAFDIQSLVTRKLGERIARQQADHWVEGTGIGQPLGITAGALATQNFTAPPTMPTTHNELIDAMLQVNEAYHPNAVFVVSFNAWGQLRKLVDTTNRPILQPDSTASIGSAPGFSLEGHPVIVDSSFDAFANGGLGVTNHWGVFGDIRETYVVRRVRDLQLVVDPFTRANEGQVQFTMWARADATIQNDFSAVVLQVVGS